MIMQVRDEPEHPLDHIFKVMQDGSDAAAEQLFEAIANQRRRCYAAMERAVEAAVEKPRTWGVAHPLVIRRRRPTIADGRWLIFFVSPRADYA